MPPDVGVVITAAGRGERMGGDTPKQLRAVAGVPMVLRAVRPFLSHPDVLQVIVVLPPAMAAAPPSWLAGVLGERLRVAAGGPERMDSVEAGLNALPAGCGIVLVHDGARPFPEPAVIDAVIRIARAGSGAIAAVPVTDTLKEAEAEAEAEAGATALGPRVARTMSRSGLWRAQTPQGFPRPMLESAFRLARSTGYVGTDEAALVERLGGTVHLVPDRSTNLKVTTPADLRLADALAAGGR